jgi:two-component system, LytTR family, response regulator
MTATAKIKTFIVDGDTPGRRRIRRFLAAEGDVEVVGESGDLQEAVGFIQERNPDLVFLDAQIPGIDGFGVLESLPPKNAPAVIFVTAFDQYAPRAFEVRALDYLLKPFDRARFRQALDRARSQIRPEGATAALDHRLTTLLDHLGVKPKHRERLLVKSAGRILFLRTDDVDWIEASDNYVRLHVGPDTHLLRETLGSFETRLDSSKFVRIHRSTMVNVNRMKELQPWFHGDYIVILEDGTRLNLSRTYRNRVIDLVGEIF